MSAADSHPPPDVAPGDGSSGERSLETVALRLHSAAIRLLRRLRTADVEAGMTPARLSALSVLVLGGAASLSELAAAEQVSAPTMSRLVAALEEEGLVTRRPDPEDGRAVRIEATRQGRRVLETGRSRRVARLVGLMSRLEREEVEVLARSAGLLEELLAGEREGGTDAGP